MKAEWSDPILLTVITNRLEGITREMGAGMLRSSRSPIFAENKDFVTAVFFDGELRFWVLARGHHADIGGGGAGGYNPNAKTIWEEGLRIPPARLYVSGKY